MNHSPRLFPLLGLCAPILLASVASAHGANYPAPTPGPVFKGPTHLGSALPNLPPKGTLPNPFVTGDAAPAQASPSAPAPSARSGAAPRGAAPKEAQAQVTTPVGGDAGPDLTTWDYWWEFNKAPYLELRRAIHATGVRTGDADWFLGRGTKRQLRDVLAPDDATVRQRIVPALERALAGETNNDLITGAMIALARIGDSWSADGRFEKFVAPFLSDANQEIAETAAVSLGILANDGSVPRLMHLLLDTKPGRTDASASEVPFRTRAFAAYALGLVGSHTESEPVRMAITRTLVQVLDTRNMSRDRDVKVACMVALGLVPLSTVEPTGERLSHKGDPLPLSPHRSRAGQIEYALDYLERESEAFLVRAHVPTTLARLLADLPAETREAYKERVARALLDRLGGKIRTRNEELRGIVLALGGIGDNDGDALDVEIREALIDVPRSVADVQTRNFSSISLAQTGGRMGRSGGTAEGIAEVQRELVDRLVRGKTPQRPWAGVAIGVFGHALGEADVAPPQDMAVALREALRAEGNPQRAAAYAIGAGLLGDDAAKPLCLEKLEQLQEDRARGYVAVALGLLDAREAIEPIQQIIERSEYRPVLLGEAAVALGLLGDKDLVPYLVDRLAKARSLSSQAATARALGLIGDVRSIEPLIAMLKNRSFTERARAFAAVALGIVADKDPLPWNSRISVGVNYRATAETLCDNTGRGVLNIL